MIDQLCKTLQENGQIKSIDELVDDERPIQRYTSFKSQQIQIIIKSFII